MNLLLLARSAGAGFPIFVLFVVFVIVLIAWGVGSTVAGYRRILQDAARRLGGKLELHFWTSDRLEFDADGVPAELTHFSGTDKAPPWTRLRFLWNPPGQLRVLPEGFFAKLRKTFGAQDIRIGDEAFDHEYLIQGSPEEWVREVLDGDVRARLRTLSGLGATFWRGGGIRLEAGPPGVTVFCYRHLVRKAELLDTFIAEGRRILQAFRGHATAGVTLDSMEVVRQGRCPVCATPAESDLRRCGTCRVAHHRDCWTYFGGCAIYGCGRSGVKA